IVATTKFQDHHLLDGSFQGDFLVSVSGSYDDGSGGVGSDFVTIDGTALQLDTATLGLDGLDLTTADNARDVLAAIDEPGDPSASPAVPPGALAVIAQALGDIGAAQNRIEHAFNNTNI